MKIVIIYYDDTSQINIKKTYEMLLLIFEHKTSFRKNSDSTNTFEALLNVIQYVRMRKLTINKLQ